MRGGFSTRSFQKSNSFDEIPSSFSRMFTLHNKHHPKCALSHFLTDAYQKQAELKKFMDFTNSTQIHSKPQFSLGISIMKLRHLYGKPPTLLRDSGSKSPIFFNIFLKIRVFDHQKNKISCMFISKFFWQTRAFVVSGVFRTSAQTPCPEVIGVQFFMKNG